MELSALDKDSGASNLRLWMAVTHNWKFHDPMNTEIEPEPETESKYLSGRLVVTDNDQIAITTHSIPL